MNQPIRKFLLFTSLLGGLTHSIASNAASAPAEVIYHNGTIYTVNPMQPWAEAVAMRDGKIIAVGTDEELKNWVGDDTQMVNLDKNFVMPGLHDSHVHPIKGGLKTQGLFVHPDSSAQEVAAIIKQYADQHPEQTMIVAKGYGFAVDAHRKWLDAVVPDRAVFVEGFGGHTFWLNSKALELAGITQSTPTPEGGAIIRDAETGELTGVLFDTAKQLIQAYLPKEDTSLDSKIEVARTILQQMSGYGITSFKEASGDEDTLKAYRALEDAGELHARTAVAILDPGSSFGDGGAEGKRKAQALIDRRSDFESELVNPNFVKIFLDGVPPAIALIDPPPTIKEPMTEPLIKANELATYLQTKDRQGISVMAHAHGEAAIRAFLDAVAVTRSTNGPGQTHHIAHCSTIRPVDALRLRNLDVVCEMSPYLWFPSTILDMADGIMGEQLMHRMYPANTVISNGGYLVAGSDWAYDNFDLNPFPYLEALVTRKDPFGRRAGDTLNPDQAISLSQAIKAFTLDAARALESEDKTGSLEVGKYADFIVLDSNPYEIPASEIDSMNVMLTVFNGQPVFQRDEDTPLQSH